MGKVMKILSRLARSAGLATGVAAISSVFLGILLSNKANAADWKDQRATPSANEDWVIQSNCYSAMLMNVQFEHSPENGSQEGLRKLTLGLEIQDEPMMWRKDAKSQQFFGDSTRHIVG